MPDTLIIPTFDCSVERIRRQRLLYSFVNMLVKQLKHVKLDVRWCWVTLVTKEPQRSDQHVAATPDLLCRDEQGRHSAIRSGVSIQLGKKVGLEEVRDDLFSIR